jgi:hypothetical protein
MKSSGEWLVTKFEKRNSKNESKTSGPMIPIGPCKLLSE